MPDVSPRRAHLSDARLYLAFYSADQQPGQIIPMKVDEPRLLWAYDHIGPRADVLDLGCHKSEMTIGLWSRTTGNVVGLDISHNALDHARRFSEQEGLDIDYVQAFAEALPFPNRSFDVAVLCEVLEHVADVATVLGEAERVVRDGGTVVVSTPVDALEVDKRDAVTRDVLTGFQLDQHVRDFDPRDWLGRRRGFRYERGSVRYPDGDTAYFHLASYRV